MSRKDRCISNGEYASFIDEWHLRLISRRKFILGTAAVLSAGLFSTGILSEPATTEAGEDKAGPLGGHALLTLSAVQNHLFPSGKDVPGAKEINALQYMKWVLADPRLDDEEKTFIRNGTGWLNDLSKSTLQRDFLSLNEGQRERLLRQIEKSPAGENWLSTLLLYIFEALLCAPVYGGNPEGIGWKWLEHQPGFPLPPAEKMYGKL